MALNTTEQQFVVHLIVAAAIVVYVVSVHCCQRCPPSFSWTPGSLADTFEVKQRKSIDSWNIHRTSKTGRRWAKLNPVFYSDVSLFFFLRKAGTLFGKTFTNFSKADKATANGLLSKTVW